MTALWTSAEAERATLGRATQSFDVSGISIDTRKISAGDLFVAIKGESRDGHEFVSDAFKAGAAAALVSHGPEGLPVKTPLLVVANTQRALEDLARAARARASAQVVAVTGSAGKTTTKDMLRRALGALGPTCASAASYNNQWGVPLSVASLPRAAAYGVFEIGMNHFGEIRALVGIVRPHVALITTIAAAHLEFFGSCEAIADAKSEIFEGLVPGGTAILPADSPYFDRLSARARQAGVTQIHAFGAKPGSDARLVATNGSDEAMIIEAEIFGRPFSVRIGASGAHIATNAVATLAAVAVLGGDVAKAGAALAAFEPLNGRGARFVVPHRQGRIAVIDESYNANPASMRAAIALLGTARVANGGRRIAVLGDMLEMGPQGVALHAALAHDIEKASVDCVYACGEQMAALWDALPELRRGGYGHTSQEIAPLLAAALHDGDVVLVKGSLGSRMAVVIDALRSGASAG
jgi:UDP-N-acetylmuramoyl-tripeptide--D-alanyl-D-alanine ligase